jgi:hypothetical protein
MIIPLYLGADSFLRHNEIITLPEDKVEIEVKRTAFSNGDIILSVSNENAGKQYKVGRDPVDITELCNIPGRVDMAISLSVRGEVARTWQVEPLCIKEVPCGFKAIPEIAELRRRVSNLEKAVMETVEIIKN